MAASPAGRAALRRLPALLAVTARMDLLWILDGPRTAAAWYVADAIFALSAVSSTFLVAERFGGIGAWSKSEVLFLLGFALLVRGIVDLGFGFNVSFISRRIGRGQLDHMLLMPQPLWTTILADGFCPASGSAMAVAGLAALATAVRALDLALTAGWLALFAVHVLSASAVVLAFSYLWATLAFVAPRAAEEINSESMGLIRQLAPFPLDGMDAWLTAGLVSVVPAGFVAWLPSRVLLGKSPDAVSFVWTPLAALGFVLLAAAAFRAGLRRYGRTGSTRYLAHGHRR
jgi:ABC-2 type transport system permease protein